MIRIPMQQEFYSPQAMVEPSGSPEPEFKSTLPGVNVLPLEQDETMLKYQAAAEVTRDLQAWKAATEAWQKEYMTTRTGQKAQNAAEEARAFHEERFKPLQEKYAKNLTSLRYLQEQGSSISNQSIGFMSAYAKEEGERFVNSVLAEEERELRNIMTSPYSSGYSRKEAFVKYVFKVENWRLARGESAEEVKAWKNAFIHNLMSEALHARFDRILDRDPDQALTLVRIAQGDMVDASSDQGGAASSASPERISPPPLGDNEDNPDQNQGRNAHLYTMAPEYTKFISAQQLQRMRNRAEAEKYNPLRLAEERTRAMYSEAETLMLRAIDGGDFSSLQTVENELTAMGKSTEARFLAVMHEAMAQAQPYLTVSRFEPFATQRRRAREFFARPEFRGGGAEQFEKNDNAMIKTLAIAERGITEREKRFMRDPAGYVASHPLLSREGVSIEEFCKQEGITLEEYFTRSLQIQEQIGREAGITPRVLPEARAGAIKDQYEGFEDSSKKAEFLRQAASHSGKYAPMALAEAGLPMGVVAFTHVLSELPISETTKLAQAATQASLSGMSLDSMELSDASKAEIRQRVAACPLTKALLAVDGVLSATKAQPGKPGVSARETIHALERFVALGGNLPDLERRVVLATMQLSKDISDNVSHGEPGDTPQQSFWDQQAHSFGVGTRGVVDGAMGAADYIASPARFLLNGINRMFGGDPNYFQPVGSQISDALSLPTPKNKWEEIAYSMNKGGTEAICMVWGASALMTQKVATSVPDVFWNVINTFRTGPAGQVASGVGSELGLLAAQSAGAGPFGSITAAVAGGIAGGKAAPRGAPAAGYAASTASAFNSAASEEPKVAKAARQVPFPYPVKTPQEFGNWVKTKPQEAYAAYTERFGNKLDVDDARKLCEAYETSRAGRIANTEAVHKPASNLINGLFEQMLKEAPGQGQRNLVTFTAGAGGSGKSTAIRDNPALREQLEGSQIIYDTTFAGSGSLKKLESSLAAGKDVEIFYVARDPLDAIISTFHRAQETGRYVPLDILVKGHMDALTNIREAAKKYVDNDRVQIRVIDNTEKSIISIKDITFLDSLNYNNFAQRAKDALDKESQNGRITVDLYNRILHGVR